MKKIISIFLLLAFFSISCEQEEFVGSGLEGLRDFQLTQVPNSKLALNSLEPDGEIIVNWSIARSGFNSPVTYTWLFDEVGGDFSSPLLSLTADDNGLSNSITFTNQQLEEALDELGVADGAEFEGIWTVRATNGEVTKMATKSALTIMRYSEAVMSFDLLSPSTNQLVFLKESLAQEDITITWEATISGLGTAVKYKWLADEPGGDFSTPVLSLDSDENGSANTLTLTHEALETALAGVGVEEKSKASLIWTVRATAGSVVQQADQTFDIGLVRWGTEVTFRLTSLPSTMPAGKDIFVAGEFGFLGAGYENWQQPGTNSLLKLTQDEDDSYFINLNVPKGQSIQYKFALATAAEPSWDIDEQQANGADDGCEGITNRTYTFDGSNGGEISHSVFSWKGFCPFDVVEVTFELKQYDVVPVGYDVFVAGEFGNLGVAPGNWQEPGSNQSLKFTLDDDNVYRLKLAVSRDQANTTIQYKYFLAPNGGTSWGNGEQSFSQTGCQGLHGGAEGDNRKYSYIFGDGSPKYVEGRVITWEGFCAQAAAPRARFEVTVPAGTPTDKDVYITGNLGFLVWAQPGTAAGMRMRPVNGQPGKYEIYLPVPQGTEVQFKFFLATTEAPNWGNGEQQFNGGNTGCEGIENRTFTYNGSNEFIGTVISWEGYCPL